MPGEHLTGGAIIRVTQESVGKAVHKMNKKNTMMSGVSNAQRRRIYKRDGFRCALCDDARDLAIHHIIPRGKGGRDYDENLICLCRFCHGLAHGLKLRDYCDMEPGDAFDEMMVDYVADLYIDEGFIWVAGELMPYEPVECSDGEWAIDPGTNEMVYIPF